MLKMWREKQGSGAETTLMRKAGENCSLEIVNKF